MSESSKTAFTLAEMMIFLGLAAAALFALIAAQFYAVKASQGSRHRQLASNLAFSHLSRAESALRRDFSLNQTIPLTRLPQAEGFSVALSDTYAPDGLENLKHLRCSIYWNEASHVREFRASLDLFRGP